MGDDRFSGIFGLAGIAGCIVAFFVLRNIFPVLANIILAGCVILVVLTVITVISVIAMAFKKPEEGEGAQSSKEITSLQKEGRAALIELRRVGMKIKNQDIRKDNDEICEIANKIISELKNHKESISQLRHFFSYYLPTLGKILANYEKLEKSGNVEENVTQSTLQCLGDIKAAMEKQYNNLFEKYVLDMTVEMEALTLACKRDGLILEEEQEDKITLTL